MGKNAARKGDRIVSSSPGDFHILLPPGGPPTPVPHACSAVTRDGVIESVQKSKASQRR
ncbi:MAG: hypothetical protein ACKVX7_08085 [Planctomycetota bacterium]